jgi:hypothetical protein
MRGALGGARQQGGRRNSPYGRGNSKVARRQKNGNVPASAVAPVVIGGGQGSSPEIGWKRVEGAAHRVWGSAAATTSIPTTSAGSGDRVWTRGSGEECRDHDVPLMEGKTRREREGKRGVQRQLAPFIAVAAGERGGGQAWSATQRGERGGGGSRGATVEEEVLRPVTKTRPRRAWAVQQRRAQDRGEGDADAWARSLCQAV